MAIDIFKTRIILIQDRNFMPKTQIQFEVKFLNKLMKILKDFKVRWMTFRPVFQMFHGGEIRQAETALNLIIILILFCDKPAAQTAGFLWVIPQIIHAFL